MYFQQMFPTIVKNPAKSFYVRKKNVWYFIWGWNSPGPWFLIARLFDWHCKYWARNFDVRTVGMETDWKYF